MSLLGRFRRSLVPVYQHHSRKLHDLQYVFFELTRNCNLACRHCGSDCIKDPEAPSLAVEKVLGVLRDIKSRHDSRKIAVALTGGEPLCYPGLFELGGEIAALEFPWGMVTNGWAWTPKVVEAARVARMHSITVSLDGFAASHDWLRGRKGSHQRAEHAISLLAGASFLQAMDVITCVNRRNLSELEDLADRLVGLGIRTWRLFTISPIGRAAAQPELFLTPDEYRGLLDRIRALRERSDIRVSLSESGYLGCERELEVRDQPYFCRAGVNVGGIMVDGDILACPNIDRRFRQGNIHENSFVDVWENRYEAFRNRDWMKVGRCSTCSEWRHCQGNSFHLWDLDRNETKLCHYRDLGLDSQTGDAASALPRNE